LQIGSHNLEREEGQNKAGVKSVFVKERPAQLFEEIRPIIRSPDVPDDPDARDRLPHADATYWGGNTNPFATVLYARDLEGPVADTGFYDTVSLLRYAEEHEHPGITKLLRGGTTVFSGAHYYTSILQAKGQEAVNTRVKAKGANNFHELGAEEERKYPPKRIKTIQINPFNRREECIMIDVPHTVSIEGTELSEEQIQEIITGLVKNYIALPPKELARRPYYKLHKWEKGDVLTWTQKGTLHEAGASPPGEIRREMFRHLIVNHLGLKPEASLLRHTGSVMLMFNV
jgi:alpha-ketoglutarate-dependent taurine dioxygenase